MKLLFGKKEYDTGKWSTVLIGGKKGRKKLVDSLMRQAVRQKAKVLCIGESDIEGVQTVTKQEATSLLKDIAGETEARMKYHNQSDGIMVVITDFNRFRENRDVLDAIVEIEKFGGVAGTVLVIETGHASKMPVSVRSRLRVRYSSKCNEKESKTLFGNLKAVILKEGEFTNGIDNTFCLKGSDYE